ncbi:hypothetical protein GGR34_001100 [Microvirga flocculans]|uniref:DUF2188 domain-containing protein n=1 Tax=Microvirga flocculans TaxID=217168 RepID=A0A7W6IDG5_9HYPH|nr:hypothetical protein [Microvirga flocculans]MBB4039458.1 hypothetical protein [Microvirga flocculans]
MHTDRFVVFKFQGEWLVTYADRKQTAFATRQDAERSAFDAADTLASSGHAVSVLIIPDTPDEAAISSESAMTKSSLN